MKIGTSWSVLLMHFSAAMIALSVNLCIEIFFGILLEHTLQLDDLDLLFMLQWPWQKSDFTPTGVTLNYREFLWKAIFEKNSADNRKAGNITQHAERSWCKYSCLCFVVIFSKRQKIHVPALRVWSSDHPHPQEEVNICLQILKRELIFLYIFLSQIVSESCL